MEYSSQNIVDLLWSTLHRLEAELDPADPELKHLKSSILRSIAELDMYDLDAA